MHRNKNRRKKKNKLLKKLNFLGNEQYNNNLNKTFIKKESNILSNEDKTIDLNISYDLEPKNKSTINEVKDKTYNINNSNIIFNINNNCKIIKYSNPKKIKKHELIFQYFFDEFKPNDYNKAYIILFFGKKMNGKSSVINSFLNIIKGVNPDNDYRYFFIEKPKEGLENGLHLYYIKDINNNPIIMINCQGYGDLRGKEYDDEINKAFDCLFNNLIYHINLICYIGKEKCGKLDILDKYIFNCTTSLFTEDIIENFIIIVTHANKNILNNEFSSFISYLSDDINFDDIKCKLENKWKYFIDNESLFLDKTNDLTIYSFDQLNEIYRNKILNSKPKITKNFPKFINYKLEIIQIVKNIVSDFNDIKTKNEKIPNLEKNIKYYENSIKNKNDIIKSKDSLINSYNSNLNYYNNQLYNLEKEHNSIMNNLDNQYEDIENRVLEYSSSEHTYCHSCKKNCHEYCDCFGFLVDRCSIIPIFGDYCNKCGHNKSCHIYHSHYRYISKYEKRKIPNYDKKNEENNRYNKRKKEINDSINYYRNSKNNSNSEKNNLINEKNNLQNSKYYYINEKQKNNNIIKKLSEEIYSLINKLIDIDKNIKKDAMNKFHINIEIDYIDMLIEEFKKNKDNDKITKLEKLKEYFNIYNELTSNYLYLLGFKMYIKNI